MTAHTWPPFAVTVDAVVATIRNGQLSLLLVERGETPHRDAWALPGGFVHHDETTEDAVLRELLEETGVDLADRISHLEQLRTYSDPARDPRMRTVTVAYVIVVADSTTPTAGGDATGARWWPVDDLDNLEIAFDHNTIIGDGLERIRAKFEYTSVAAAFCDEPFTLSDLRRVYETVWGVPLDRANFARKVLASDGFVVPTSKRTTKGTRIGRPAQLYTRGTATLLHPALLRPDTDEN